VLEHVQYLMEAAKEISRVLKPGAIFVASIPNPTAPEFFLSKHTPLFFHRLIRGKKSWSTYYAFKNIKELSSIFEKVGFCTIDIAHWSFILGYLHRFFILKNMAYLYDATLNKFQLKSFMNNVCIVFKKS